MRKLNFNAVSNTPKVIVFACGAFALNTLQLLSHKNMLAGVILPDPAELERGGQEVHQLANQLQQARVPFQMCCKAKLPVITEQLARWGGNVGMSVSYPHIFPSDISQYFSGHFYNVHTSLLPNYKGPAPLYWQLRNGETETAITLHAITNVVDAGEILVQHKLPIHPLDTLASLANRLAYESSVVVADFLHALEGKKLLPILKITTPNTEKNVSEEGLFYSRRPTFSDSVIDFLTMGAAQISAMCRAGNNQPSAALVDIKGVPVSVIQSTPLDQPTYGTAPGTIILIGEPEGLVVSTIKAALRLDILMSADGLFSGLAFAERFNLDAGQNICSVSTSPREKTA